MVLSSGSVRGGSPGIVLDLSIREEKVKGVRGQELVQSEHPCPLVAVSKNVTAREGENKQAALS